MVKNIITLILIRASRKRFQKQKKYHPPLVFGLIKKGLSKKTPRLARRISQNEGRMQEVFKTC